MTRTTHRTKRLLALQLGDFLSVCCAFFLLVLFVSITATDSLGVEWYLYRSMDPTWKQWKSTKRIHVWYMYLHWPWKSTKCRKINISDMDPMGLVFSTIGDSSRDNLMNPIVGGCWAPALCFWSRKTIQALAFLRKPIDVWCEWCERTIYIYWNTLLQ